MSHFRFEERTELVERALRSRADAPAEVAAWRDSHARFARQLQALLERLERRAEEQGLLDEPFIADLRQLFRDLRRHDALEVSLLEGERVSFAGDRQDSSGASSSTGS